MSTKPGTVQRDAAARVHGAWHEVRRADARAQQIYGRRQQQAFGILGEDELAWALSVLPDDWVLLRGYRNRCGETDQVLVGPSGIWVIEVKYRRVRLNIDGDEWWYEKLDHRGSVVGVERAIDGGRRSWARQVNDVAFDLAAWLTRNRYEVPIYTAVMLMSVILAT
ncbi:NERD domain-containing protein [Kibdelosporangium philippinense]|uniref:NERD domain-containing protein n=1 Tax=Kibdelosporangium philippinense TaxID=211113 RepID=A0ABS8ZK64_9PSEU|nr:nuclease-related domain-containing protein [Kibdelosporangium philippinense]MCE7007360.1 NERD domain-containing protein [Kibdelosporangium philippinense]